MDSTETMRQEIAAVMKYRNPLPSGDFYVGSMATAHVAYLVGATGWGSVNSGVEEVSIEEALGRARQSEVADVHHYLRNYIKYMKAHPIGTCGHCGSTIRISKAVKMQRRQ